MLRRNARLRKEYLLRKANEGSAQQELEKRKMVKEALETGKKLSPDLKYEAEKLDEAAQWDDPTIQSVKTHVDDEYGKVGQYDPKILVTSAREPSGRLLQFIKEFRLCLPNSHRINRGNIHLEELVELCRNHDYTDLVIVHEHAGEPDGLVISHFPYGPTIYFSLSGTVLRHDLDQSLGTISEAYPHLIFNGFSSQLGKRVSSIVQALFPVPKADSRRVISFFNREDTISFRHHVYKRNPPHLRDEQGNKKDDVELAEVGPRFELKPYKIVLGTLEMKAAETEWVLKTHYKRAITGTQL